MTRCIGIVETEGPLLMKMWFQRDTASTLFTAIVTSYDLLLYCALSSDDPSYSCHNLMYLRQSFELSFVPNKLVVHNYCST
jgi:hypothetical protein